MVGTAQSAPLPTALQRRDTSHSGARNARTRNLEIPGLVLTHQPGMTATQSLLQQRAIARLERLGRVFRRDYRDLLVVVPGVFRLLGLLHLEQIGRDQAAAVGPQRALAEQGI